MVMRIHLVQLDCVWEDRAANRAKVAAMLDDAALRAGAVVVLPEMFDTGFSFRLAVTADSDGATLEFLKAQAKSRDVTIIGSRSVMGADGKGRNRCTIVGPRGDVLAEYDKVHPFSLGVPGTGRECDVFAGGCEVVTTRIGAGDDSFTLCPTICYDLRFPELYREGLKRGADMFTVIANWPDIRAFHFRTLCIARAIENQAFVVVVNRCGKDPTLNYAGGSMVVSPLGEIVGDAGDGEKVLSVEIDLGAVKAWREKFPAWRDRRM